MKRLDDIIEKHFSKIFWGLSGVFLILYLALIGGDYLWTDEAYTFAMIKHSFGEIWKITGADVHPPLYYWYIKVLTTPFNYNTMVAKVASIIPFMFIIIWGGWQMRKYFNGKTAILFMVMFFCFPFAMPYSVEIRMYSLAAAFVFTCGVFAYKLWLENGNVSNAAGLIVSGVLAAYTHYFALVSVGVIYGVLLIAILLKGRQLWGKWLLCVITSIVLYAPWISSLFSQLAYKVNNEYWIEAITVRTILGYFNSIFRSEGIITYVVFFALAYLMCFIWVIYSKDYNDIILCTCCLLVPAGTLAVGVFASIIIRPVFMIRYILPSIPFMVVFMSIVMGKIRNGALFSCIMTVVLMGGINDYAVNLYSEYTNHNYVPVEEYSTVDAYIVIGDKKIAGTLGYYVTDKNFYFEDAVDASNPFPNKKQIDDFDSDNVDEAILLLSDGYDIPDEYIDLYDMEYLGQWQCQHGAEAYLLTKK